MKKKRAGAVVFAVFSMIFGLPGSALASGIDTGGSGLFGDLNAYGLTKEDLRREKQTPDAWQYQEAVGTGSLETAGEASSSFSIEVGGTRYRAMDVGP